MIEASVRLILNAIDINLECQIDQFFFKMNFKCKINFWFVNLNSIQFLMWTFSRFKLFNHKTKRNPPGVFISVLWSETQFTHYKFKCDLIFIFMCCVFIDCMRNEFQLIDQNLFAEILFCYSFNYPVLIKNRLVAVSIKHSN